MDSIDEKLEKLEKLEKVEKQEKQGKLGGETRGTGETSPFFINKWAIFKLGRRKLSVSSRETPKVIKIFLNSCAQ